ncbi:transcriptional regulator, Spx/MgsR family [Arsukibacterium tuosuense]|uniref:Transcriptional regulator, Spx/MgsR family n=1 Tax=Arsukibacterium tuosuense TaxID=1323745 RepID=A0A285IRM9_9GAMM|nr:ArsC family reductase [Arsukibacterium tuosuense]SNY50669.1 transcriptional regulator, Spx/MgsR family [Arsukibacterium tuosuense]
MIKMYGIKNCDTIKKARKWLEQHQLDYQFIDYRQDGLSAERLAAFSQQLGWQNLLNTRGTTYRALDAETKANLNEQAALALMLQQPAMIKRPLLQLNERYILGFSNDIYQQLLED